MKTTLDSKQPCVRAACAQFFLSKSAAFTLATIAFTLIASCSSTPHSNLSSLAPTNKGQELNQLVESYFEETLKLDPLFATSIGDHRFDDQMQITISAEHRARAQALVDSSLAKVKAIGCKDLSETDLLTCEAFTDDLESQSQLMKVDLDHLMPMNQFEGFFVDFPDIASGSSYVTFENKNDYENFLKRMHVVPAFMDTIIENSREGIRKNITTPKVLMIKALKQMQELTAGDYHQSIFYKPLLKLNEVAKATSMSDADRDSLRTRYEDSIQNEIYPAYRKLEMFTRTEYLPHARKTHGVGALPGGKAYYAALARVNTTTTLTPEQINTLGLSEVARIRKEFEAVKTNLGYKGTLKEFFAAVRVDPKLYPFHTAQEVLDGYEKIHQRIMKAIPDQFKLLPKARFEIREVDKFKAATASESYQNASADGSRPGIFWVPVPDATRYSSKDMESLFLHEAIPGHHFQISIQQELQGLNRYRRFSGNNAYVEGWALYTEGLGKDLGMYTDPYQWVGRLSNEMHRAIRLVVDTGIHSKGWTRERAIQYSLNNEPYEANSIVSEIERYMAIPSQALSYKLGELKILELKKRTQVAFGANYDVKEFHSQILKDGALPLSTLDKKFNRWLPAKL